MGCLGGAINSEAKKLIFRKINHDLSLIILICSTSYYSHAKQQQLLALK